MFIYTELTKVNIQFALCTVQMTYLSLPFLRFSTVLVSISASILKHFNLEWLLYIWLSFGSWVTRWTLGTIATALRSEAMAVNSHGKEPLEVLETVIGKLGTATMVL